MSIVNGIFVKKVDAMPYLILVILWVLFYATHTWLASLNIKRKIKGWMGSRYIWYRLLYTVFSTVFIFGILLFSSSYSQIHILTTTSFTTYLGYVLASFGTIIIVRSFKSFSKRKFVGLEPHDDLEKSEDFITTGLHAYVRHPIYSGTVLIFLGFFFYDPTLSSAVHVGMLFLYLPIGIHYEEKKLIEIYGEKYIQYKKKVASLIPTKRK
ncbi:isoprenylcysteine carboxylmethyltransferase family protein [Aquiflexum sp. TKW24L]|uniref:methyltransferase family protein n=1 Tax=Aquiflexum sp. TKW24L TaxID=2942212 RepID=UPI0020BD8467|nr:isoprenylcysteine carboxylmethyltransferase family protein [Aquiflexum sp. TKW24L]MCL6258477.1 isoprenylcysteine carboxylmethyltransferase family protein [Aquiflexum sp. TKW24L]